MTGCRGLAVADLDEFARTLTEIAYHHPHPYRYDELLTVAEQLRYGPYRHWAEIGNDNNTSEGT